MFISLAFHPSHPPTPNPPPQKNSRGSGPLLLLFLIFLRRSRGGRIGARHRAAALADARGTGLHAGCVFFFLNNVVVVVCRFVCTIYINTRLCGFVCRRLRFCIIIHLICLNKYIYIGPLISRTPPLPPNPIQSNPKSNRGGADPGSAPVHPPHARGGGDAPRRPLPQPPPPFPPPFPQPPPPHCGGDGGAEWCVFLMCVCCWG